MVEQTGRRVARWISSWILVFPPAKRFVLKRKAFKIERRVRPWIGDLSWEAVDPCPMELYDAGGAQIGHLLYVIRGYRRLSEVNPYIFVLDMRRGRWIKRILPPVARLAHSHCAIATDGARYIYFVSGQFGPQCSPAISDGWAFDTASAMWTPLPPLPEPRYAATMQFWRGRLHIIGGAKPDRWTATADHWSLGVREGKATESAWRREVPLPMARLHHVSVVVGDDLYIFGGQQGDYQAIPGDLQFTCTHRTLETYLSDGFLLRKGRDRWDQLPDMPVAVSHVDASAAVAGHNVCIAGGQIYKDPQEFFLRLTDVVQAFDTRSGRWSIAGRMPYRVKLPVAGLYNGRLFAATGQRDTGGSDDTPGEITAFAWSTNLDLLRTKTSQAGHPINFTSMDRKKIVFITHDLTQSGAPLSAVEAASEMIKSGAEVLMCTLAIDAAEGNPALRYGIPLIPLETSFQSARRADLVIANTAVSKNWVREYLKRWPEAGTRLAWWLHEIDIERYAMEMECLSRVAAVVYDSRAALNAWRETGLELPKIIEVIHPAPMDVFFSAADASKLVYPETGRLLDRDEIRSRLGAGRNDFLLCVIGLISPVKGQRLLVKTLGRMLEQEPRLRVKLLLVGFRSRQEQSGFLKDLTRSEHKVLSKKRAVLVQTDIAAFLRAADAYVMNTQGVRGRGETFGRVTTEAMVFGLPVLGTNAGGTPEIVIDEATGLLHPAGEAGQDQLAKNIRRLAGDRALAKRMGEAGALRARVHFNPGRYLAQMDRVLNRVLRNPPIIRQ